MNKVDLLAQVVDNAMDFLRQSIREFEKQPKYSAIQATSSIEPNTPQLTPAAKTAIFTAGGAGRALALLLAN